MTAPLSPDGADAAVCCSLCGGTSFRSTKVLWPELIDEWQLAPHEVAYIDRQQGEACTSCGANLRQIALSDAILTALAASHTLKETIAASPNVAVLDVNGSEPISSVLSDYEGYLLAAYPDVDLQQLPYDEASFDLVVHSDTLEHVPDPIKALRECRRVLRPGGHLCFTVPIVIGRMTRGRQGLKKSYHGNPEADQDDLVVHTEFGADAWTMAIQAGFSRITLNAVAYPSAIALTAIKT